MVVATCSHTSKQLHSDDDDDWGDSFNERPSHLSEEYRPFRDDNDSPGNFASNASTMTTQKPHTFNSPRLIPTSVLPDAFRQLFKFGVFNAMQSEVFDTVLESTANLVISAPTGSGKTVLFELGIVRLLKTNQQERKCVYMAPTKALCSERFRDWAEKFRILGIKCCELTGDTVEYNANALGEAKQSTIIITTPEKFDSLSRNWRDNREFISQIGLFLIDEVHILNDTRGSTLEVVISRMKSRASLRFIVVSATVPNINDVAEWVGNESSTGSATVFTFGEHYRPCRLARFVYGFPRKNQNEFSFDRSLDYKLLPLLSAHADNKPSLIFCSTRKGTVATAETLMKEYIKLLETRQCVPWTKPRCLDATFADQKLQELASYGIGVHHAGLGLEDRRSVERLFLKKIIQIVVATSTLAVGVNLPAHTVVIKGVKTWQNGEWSEYSELDFIQMIGRAGRPQFDEEGIALILCNTEQEKKFKEIATQQICLESCLHRNLVEHVNSEIGLGTITNLATAKEWLHNSFLFYRIQKNPRHYALDKSLEQSWENRLDELVETSISDLQQSKLITVASNNEYKATEYGDIMSKFYIRLNTMKAIINLPETASVREILQAISNAEELSELRLRSGEKQIYRKLSEHNDIRFPSRVEKAADKIFILIQAVLGGVPLAAPEYKTPDSQPFLEAITILKHSVRVVRTIVEVALVKKHGLVLKSGMELLTGKAWEDRPIVLRQINHIGDKSIKVLTQNNITTFAALRKTTPSQLELILNRRPPFGTQILTAISELPQYDLDITDSHIQPSRKNKAIMIELTIKCRLSGDTGETGKNSKRKSTMLGMTSILTVTNEFSFIDFRRIPTRALRQPKIFSVTVAFEKPSQFVVVTVSPDNFAGLSVTTTYKPSISAGEYPVPQTKPPGYDVDEILAGLEDDPTFWQAAIDSDEALESKSVQKAPTQEKQSERPKQFSDLGKLGSTVPVKLPNGNYRCNHTCKRKNQCRHLCCRDGLSRPPKRNPASCSQSSIQASELRPSLKKPAAFDNHNLKGTLLSKPTSVAGKLVSSTEKKLDMPKKGGTTADSENLISSDDESLPNPDKFFEHFGEMCDEDIIVIDDSESRSQSMITDDIKEVPPVLPEKRKSPAITIPRPFKYQKTSHVSPSGLNRKEATRCTPLFLPSSPFDRKETDFTRVSQVLTIDNDTETCDQFVNETKDEKEQCNDNDEQNHPSDGYARDYAELCAWLMDVAE